MYLIVCVTTTTQSAFQSFSNNEFKVDAEDKISAYMEAKVKILEIDNKLTTDDVKVKSVIVMIEEIK